ncbi:methyl-accepting chemotaxis protein [Oceanidesulfovibrio marinus]|uniref:Chemotaxis protein n=1 Tax=Oceanidesulfovibrio marinus TaxID=370038 RepID=A0A6P1ZAU2_9BACT|nr:methyl-accepting chemotaxis protein [Oceanidesulfovibrio marinus]TVM30368.1 chemotaxis protein [Oceanidesulfovibrio marinus]
MDRTRRGVLHSIGNRATLVVICILFVMGGLGTGLSVLRLLELSEHNVADTYDLVLSRAKDAIRNQTHLPYQVVRRHAEMVRDPEPIEIPLRVVAGQVQAALQENLPPDELREHILELVADAGHTAVYDIWASDGTSMAFNTDAGLMGAAIDDPSLFADATGALYLVQAMESSRTAANGAAVYEYARKGEGGSALGVVVHIPDSDWFVGSEAPIDALIRIRQQQALDELKAMRLQDGNYFWVNDTSEPLPHMIMHPTSPSLDGKALANPKFDCAVKMQAGQDGEIVPLDNKNLFVAMVDVVKHAGEGFVWYQWTKPTEDGGVTKELYPKLSYVILYEPWGWVIGNGIYIDDIQGIVSERQQVFEQHIRAMMLKIAVISLVLLLFVVVGLLWYFRRLITRPIGKLAAFSEDITRGDLDAQLSGYFPGETKDLKDSMEIMVGSLKQAVQDAEDKGREAEAEAERTRQALDEAREAGERAMEARKDGLREAAGKLEDLVDTLRNAADDLASRVADATSVAENQREQVSEAAMSMGEMNTAVMDVAENASRASKSADAAREKAGMGKTVVTEVVGSIHTVADTTTAMQTSLKDLAEQAEAIGRVMTVINDIADQTNLLALNAAIEAARAGDAGRGFAVVADEVRKLAEKTMQATDEVGRAVSSIQSGVAGAGRHMDESADAVRQSSDLAGQAGSALEDIVRMVDEATDQVRAIATASEEQSASSETISRTMGSVSELSDATAQNMDEAVEAIGKLTALAAQLTELMDSLRNG